MKGIISVTSAGHDCGNKFSVTWDGQPIEILGKRGIGLVVFEKDCKVPSVCRLFDTFLDPYNCVNLCKALEKVRDGSVIVMGVKDEGSRCLTPELIEIISKLGSCEFKRLGHRESWAMIVKKGQPNTVHETRKKDIVNLNQLIS